MKHSSEVVIAAPIEVVIPWVSDLSLYPQWMPLVHVAEALGDNAWAVEFTDPRRETEVRLRLRES